jgi:WD40 repeat protein
VALAGHGDAVTDAAFDRSGDAVLTTSADGRARLWSSRVGADLEDVVREIPKPISAATFSDDGRTVAAAGPSATRVLRARDGQDLARVSGAPGRGARLSRDGSLLATAEPKRVAVWRAATGERVSPRSATTTTTAGATALAISPDARRLAIGKRDGSILVSTPATVRTARLTRGRAP